jgi:hypothetical protein
MVVDVLLARKQASPATKKMDSIAFLGVLLDEFHLNGYVARPYPQQVDETNSHLYDPLGFILHTKFLAH